MPLLLGLGLGIPTMRPGSGGAGAPVDAYTVNQTYTPAANLTDFPVMVDLALIDPARQEDFWAGVRPDGGNIRAYASAGGAQYPLDIATINHGAQDGTLWVKVPSLPSAGGASFVLVLGPSTQEREARDATYGSAAVWSDYHSVFLGGENTDDRASTSRVFPVEGDGATFLNVGNPEMTFAADPHQGMTWHRVSGEVYTSDNNALRRYDASGTLLTSNTDPNGDIMTATGMTGLIHLCDLCIVGDWLIVPANDYPTGTKCALAVFDRTTLALVAATNVSATDPEISGICWNPDTSRLYTCRWGAMAGLKAWSLDMSTGAIAHLSGNGITFTSPFVTGQLTNRVQGVEYWRGHYWLTDDTRDEVVRVKPNGVCDIDDSPIQFADDNSTSVTGNYEGICVYKDGLAVLADPSSANSYMIYSTPANFDFGGGGARYGTNDGYFEATGLTGSTTFTMAVSAKRSAAKQQSLASYRDFSAGTTNDRVTLAHRFVTPNYRIEAWDDVNSWLSPGTPVNAATGTWNRVAVVYNGTNRELYIDGVSRASQSGITARDAGFTAFSVGIDDTSAAESFDGDMAFAYIRHGVLSAAWLAAEHSMLSNPAGFYTISGAPPAPDLDAEVQAFLSGSTGFALDPTDTATMWQDTARTTPVGTDSDPVGSIQTKWGTGSPEYLAQGTAAARTAWAGGSSLLFDGTDDFLFGSDASMAAMSQNANYVFAAARVKFTSLATDRPFIWLSANSGASIPRCWGRVTTAGRIDLLGRRNGADSTFTLSSATGLVTTGTSYTIMFGWNFNAGTGEIWLDGTSVASGTIGGTGPTENLPANQIRAGVSSGPTRWFSGNLGRQVFAPKEPTSDERTSVADWLEEIAI